MHLGRVARSLAPEITFQLIPSFDSMWDNAMGTVHYSPSRPPPGQHCVLVTKGEESIFRHLAGG